MVDETTILQNFVKSVERSTNSWAFAKMLGTN